MTRGNFVKAVLKRLGADWTTHTRRAMQAELQAEGGSARHNPYNTTLRLPGSTSYNSVGVQNYKTGEQGIEATVRTLKENQSGYALIRKRLRANAPASAILEAIGDSAWGTDGRLALEVLDDIKADRAPNTLENLESIHIAQ